MMRKTRHIHFVGIGGIGMSGIAEVLLNLGYAVSGSDLAASDITRRLQAGGATIFQGHDAAHVIGADVVVTSSAVKPDNAEVSMARERHIPVIPRAEMLAELMRMKYGIAVAGTHGKTTTTSLIATILDQGGLDPTVVIGGRLNSLGGNAQLGQGDYLVAEADESDGSFLLLSPTIGVVTTVDAEHLDFYRDLPAIQDAFVQFVNRVPFYGCSVICLDQPHIQSLVPRMKKRYVTYGMTSQADYVVRDIAFIGTRSRFEVYDGREPLGRFTLNLPGVHNVYNALAAIAVGRELDVDLTTIAEALDAFSGIHRRFEIVGTRDGVTVVDDYGHHPEEIRQTLRAAKAVWPDARLVVVFQPHRYTRTQALQDDFHTAFYEADTLILLDIYAASEAPIPGVSSEGLYTGIKAHGHRRVFYLPGPDDVLSFLRDDLGTGDVLMTLGAGDVWKLAHAFCAA
ncbi:UDP-N-acetylmuramate--L-alanine ligase [Candidatus Entotheonella palauensis]|uniref:UDP-N-acetylmuramate--L-alanine ligase n=1 Tax=Candidatus Entotheonella gemina TaxID=1429439 RepID=W4MDD4_9BACT|nr:UDP-N-acetylmuramate--L-alanine ligase [Candidatus Entotheonella palauensis]ETX08213.1 MAG: UDP-N-acetylmuramate--alanine ligase [Candidatus Entotheonella gemina]